MDILQILRTRIRYDYPHITQEELEDRIAIALRLLQPVQDK